PALTGFVTFHRGGSRGVFKYLLRRLILSIPVLIAITIIIFLLIELAPGDIVDYYMSSEGQMTQEAVEQLRARFGLDQPLPVRYLNWLREVLHVALGFHFVDARPVAQLILPRLNATSLLIGSALIIGLLIGVPPGVFPALRQYSFCHFSFTRLSFLGISMPAF